MIRSREEVQAFVLSKLTTTGAIKSTTRLVNAIAAETDAIHAYYEGILHMTVARLGGIVEGQPTHRGDFLQRIDALREVEKTLRQAYDADAIADWFMDTEEDGIDVGKLLAATPQRTRISEEELARALQDEFKIHASGPQTLGEWCAVARTAIKLLTEAP